MLRNPKILVMQAVAGVLAVAYVLQVFGFVVMTNSFPSPHQLGLLLVGTVSGIIIGLCFQSVIWVTVKACELFWGQS